MIGGAGKLMACTISTASITMLAVAIILGVGLLVKKTCSWYTNVMLETKLKRIDFIITELKELAEQASNLYKQVITVSKQRLPTHWAHKLHNYMLLCAWSPLLQANKLRTSSTAQASTLNDLIGQSEMCGDPDFMHDLLAVAIEEFDGLIKVMAQPVAEMQQAGSFRGGFVAGAVAGGVAGAVAGGAAAALTSL
eukprot:SAG31_NODE_3835_length_3836_cov_1.537062_4_plen_194_part_00